jgi:hypothetical protein
MQRACAGVIMGGVMTFMVAFLTYPAVYLALGPEVAFESDSYRPTQGWIACNIVIGFVAASVGGFACATIGQSPKAPFALALIVAALGLLAAVMVVDRPDPGPRTDDLSRPTVLLNARHPMWFVLLNPVVGTVGILFGSRLRQPHQPPTQIRDFA